MDTSKLRLQDFVTLKDGSTLRVVGINDKQIAVADQSSAKKLENFKSKEAVTQNYLPVTIYNKIDITDIHPIDAGDYKGTRKIWALDRKAGVAYISWAYRYSTVPNTAEKAKGFKSNIKVISTNIDEIKKSTKGKAIKSKLPPIEPSSLELGDYLICGKSKFKVAAIDLKNKKFIVSGKDCSYTKDYMGGYLNTSKEVLKLLSARSYYDYITFDALPDYYRLQKKKSKKEENKEPLKETAPKEIVYTMPDAGAKIYIDKSVYWHPVLVRHPSEDKCLICLYPDQTKIDNAISYEQISKDFESFETLANKFTSETGLDLTQCAFLWVDKNNYRSAYNKTKDEFKFKVGEWVSFKDKLVKIKRLIGDIVYFDGGKEKDIAVAPVAKDNPWGKFLNAQHGVGKELCSPISYENFPFRSNDLVLKDGKYSLLSVYNSNLVEFQNGSLSYSYSSFLDLDLKKLDVWEELGFKEKDIVLFNGQKCTANILNNRIRLHPLESSKSVEGYFIDDFLNAIKTSRFTCSKFEEKEQEQNKPEINIEAKVNSTSFGDNFQTSLYRIGARKLSKSAKKAILLGLRNKSLSNNTIKALDSLLDTDYGTAFISSLASIALSQKKDWKQHPQISKLIDELRIDGMAIAIDSVIETLTSNINSNKTKKQKQTMPVIKSTFTPKIVEELMQEEVLVSKLEMTI